MIRKQTWFLLAIFVILAGVAFYLQKNPVISNSNTTPSPTSQSAMLEGWVSSDITRIEYSDNLGRVITLDEVDQGNWILLPDGVPVGLGKIEGLRSQILDSSVLNFLDPGYNLDAVGLVTPTGTLTLSNTSGKTVVVKIGSVTPTQSGYYVKVDNNQVFVVSKYAVDAFLDMLLVEKLLEYTPTPMPTLVPEETIEP